MMIEGVVVAEVVEVEGCGVPLRVSAHLSLHTYALPGYRALT